MTATDQRRARAQAAAWAALALLPKCALCWVAWGAAGIELCGAPPASMPWFTGWALPMILGTAAMLLTVRCHRGMYHRGSLCFR